MQRFCATDGNRKCAIFVFNLSSHFHINVAKSVFTSRYDHKEYYYYYYYYYYQFENLRETTVLACEMFTSFCRPWLKNVACLSSLLSLTGKKYLHFTISFKVLGLIYACVLQEIIQASFDLVSQLHRRLKILLSLGTRSTVLMRCLFKRCKLFWRSFIAILKWRTADKNKD